MLFSGLNDGMAELIRLCEGQNAVFSMFILLVLSQMSDKFEERPQEQQTQQRKSLAGSFWEQLIKRCISDTRGVLRRHVNSMNQMFRDSKPSRKARCGLLNTMRVYENFAESSLLVFGAGSTIMEQAHSDLICCLMNELDRVAAESVKTPPEVVLLENYHRLYDILCRLKLPSLNDTRKEAKARYQRALQEYSMNCMGRPLEDLHNFFEQVQSALDSGVRPDAICYQFAFQKHMLQKIIKEYPGKEVKKGLDSLRKRVEKNLSEEANLFPVVWRSIQSEVTKQCMFYEELIKKCYSDSGLALDFTIDDLQKYFIVGLSHSSGGDNSLIFNQCLYVCRVTQCNSTESATYLLLKTKPYEPRNLSVLEKIITWNCEDECKYHCMWWTVDEHRLKGVSPQQFYGRWPQIRLFGAQEPAAAFFSFLNLVTQLVTMRRFLLCVPPQAPLYAFWVLFASAGANAWLWSTVFHICDTDFTEVCFRYPCPTAWVIRLDPKEVRLGITTAWRGSDLVPLVVVIGLLTLVGWLVGIPKARDGEEQTSYRVMQATVFYIATVATLEFIDFPAILWLFDAHSLWHAATILIPFPIFSYAIKDCRNLYRIELKVRT
ncbi:Exocyst complex component [Echinococcus granulosus]|uniref:Exocyst complex component n=1 Tax=Echinococcus granulosus TaxID=6210 RepID=W6UBB4_ECHGR|nr:Exocyst complex component [Echinococcus granulosus]EUB58673.1 Exocyst complex component [Echinococcus granulosus]